MKAKNNLTFLSFVLNDKADKELNEWLTKNKPINDKLKGISFNDSLEDLTQVFEELEKDLRSKENPTTNFTKNLEKYREYYLEYLNKFIEENKM